MIPAKNYLSTLFLNFSTSYNILLLKTFISSWLALDTSLRAFLYHLYLVLRYYNLLSLKN